MAFWNSFFGNMATGDKGAGASGQDGQDQQGSWWQQQDQWQKQQDQQPTVGRDLVHNFIQSTVNPALEQNSLASLMTGGYQSPMAKRQPTYSVYGGGGQQQPYGDMYGGGNMYGGGGQQGQKSLYSLMGSYGNRGGY